MAPDALDSNIILPAQVNDLRSLDDVAFPLIVCTPDAVINYANHAALEFFQLREDQLVGRKSLHPYWLLFREGGLAFSATEWSLMGASSAERSSECLIAGMLRTAPLRGELRWVQVCATPNFDSHGELLQVMVSFREIKVENKIGIKNGAESARC